MIGRALRAVEYFVATHTRVVYVYVEALESEEKRKFAAAPTPASVNDLVCNYHFRNENVNFFLFFFIYSSEFSSCTRGLIARPTIQLIIDDKRTEWSRFLRSK